MTAGCALLPAVIAQHHLHCVDVTTLPGNFNIHYARVVSCIDQASWDKSRCHASGCGRCRDSGSRPRLKPGRWAWPSHGHVTQLPCVGSTPAEAIRRWEALDRSLRRVDAVLNEAARSTGLELDRVCDGSLGMLGCLTQMPPPLERHQDSAFMAEVPNEALGIADDAAAARCEQEAPSSGAGVSCTSQQERELRAAAACIQQEPSSGGVSCPSQPDRQSDSPCSSGCEGPGVLAHDPPTLPADIPSHALSEDRSQHESPGRQASVDVSTDEDMTQDSPRHTPREEWTQDIISISSTQEASPRQTVASDSLEQTSVELCSGPPQPEPVCAPAEEGGAEPDPDVWFEVSPNTGRVHLHAAADGSEPFGLSIPVRALLARNDPEPLLEELVKAVESRLVSL